VGVSNVFVNRPHLYGRLLGVRRPGAAFGPTNRFTDLWSSMLRQAAAGQSGAGPPHSREASIAGQLGVYIGMRNVEAL